MTTGQPQVVDRMMDRNPGVICSRQGRDHEACFDIRPVAPLVSANIIAFGLPVAEVSDTPQNTLD
jgi:hypothetical protein